jgi:hypothetical protein
MIIKSQFSSGLSTNTGAVNIKGTYVQENEVAGDILVIRELYFRTIASNETAVIKEKFDIEFFAATEENVCAGRASIVVDVDGRDATICTLSHGRCSNASFRYTYKCDSDLRLHVIGHTGSISFVGSICRD